jgi:sortase A
MSLVPNHDDNQPKKKDDPGFVLHSRHGRTVQPLHDDLEAHAPKPVPAHSSPQARVVAPSNPSKTDTSNPAVELIRRKLDELYVNEPNTKQEIKEVIHEPAAQRSRHQQFMYELSISGKPLAQIQTEWHNYYQSLPDRDKHEVWQEFYATNARQPSAYTTYVEQQKAAAAPAAQTPPPDMPTTKEAVVADHRPVAHKPERRSVADLKKQLLGKVSASSQKQLKAKHHLQSLAFGLSTGALVLVIFLFGFFNEVVVAPFIQPSRHVGATPIILSTDNVAASNTPEVIIPKINVEIPIDYNETSIDDAAVEKSLESGVLHYPTTAVPGQQGNAAFFGHSSNNIFNKGKYKFAFVLLHELVPGDIFYLTYNQKVYSYKVYDKKIVDPSNVSVLNNVPGKAATATLITCDPPGTSLHRLVVWGEQVSPDPSGNSAAPSVAAASSQPTALPSNGPTLWGKITEWVNNLW